MVLMKCDEAKAHLWEYYDDACETEVRRALEGHLSGCATCRGSLDEWVGLSQKVFSERAKVAAPAYLWTRVLAGIEAQEIRDAAWWMQWQWMGRVTAVASLFVGLTAAYV